MSDGLSVEKKYHEQLEEVNKIEKEYRGEFLSQSNIIEFMTAQVISKHFFPNSSDKYDYLFSIMLKEISFHSKIRILIKILNKYYLGLLKEMPFELEKELEVVRDFRNRIAHSVFDTSAKFLSKMKKDTVRFEFYEDGEKKFQEINRSEFNSRLLNTLKVIEGLGHLSTKIEKSQKNE